MLKERKEQMARPGNPGPLPTKLPSHTTLLLRQNQAWPTRHESRVSSSTDPKNWPPNVTRESKTHRMQYLSDPKTGHQMSQGSQKHIESTISRIPWKQYANRPMKIWFTNKNMFLFIFIKGTCTHYADDFWLTMVENLFWMNPCFPGMKTPALLPL